MSRIDDVEREISRINGEPYGTARSLAAEQLVRRVETDGPPEVLAYGYSTLVDSYVWGGEVDKAFVPFTRWVRWFDEHPEHFDAHDRYSLFWSFKWMVSHCSDYPQVPFEQIEATLADMERRYALAGHGMNGVRLEQFRWAWSRNAPETAERFREWTTTPRDEYANCEACDPSEQALYLADTGRVEEAVRLIERTLTEDPTCGTEPADMLSQLAEGYLELGKPVEAASAYRRAVRHLEGTVSAMASTRGRLILTLARGGQAERAVRRIEEDQRLLLESDTPSSRLKFLLGVVGATRVLVAQDPERSVRLREVPAATVAELGSWAHEQARELAAAFDARNRSDSNAQALAKALATVAAPAPMDLSVVPVVIGSAPEVPAGAPAAEGAADGGAKLASRADAHVSRDELAEAAPLYLAASAAFRARGELVDAGLAEANAARCAHQLEDIPGADSAYRHAIGVLRAAGAPLGLVSAVARSWVPVAYEAGTSLEALQLLAAVRGEIALAIEADDSPALRTELAESLDTHARALASLGDHEDAVKLASEAAERFAGVGRISDAAHAFWLAGSSLVAAGDDAEAVYHLESAVEGFGMARAREQRGKAATDLVKALRRLGRDEEADARARELG